MGQKYLIDTNVISDLFSNKLPKPGKAFVKKVINNVFIISIVVKIEVLTNHELPEKLVQIKEFIGLAKVLALDEIVAEKTILLRHEFRKLQLGDAIIAATALVYNLTLITRNTSDFKNIKGLHVLNPHAL